MINVTSKDNCCGCTACASVCAKGAIKMRPDALGFLYPEVNKELCNECGLCEKVCAFHPNYDKSQNLKEPDVYAVRHKDMREIETSRSGAMFIAISDWILEHGGVVYGVGYVDHFRAAHKRATNKEERNEFKGSKYVQSDLNTTFSQVRKDLKDGLYTLFSGTPCQTSGLQSFLRTLRIDMSKLYLVDIVCHAVPSPYIWRDYIKYIESNYGRKIVGANFRDKTKYKWGEHHESFVFDNETYYSNVYGILFLKHVMIRESCGKCHFANLNRPSDITIGDFWGWEKAVDPMFNADSKGVSLVLVNSIKGQELFNKIKKDIYHIKTNPQSCLQPNLQHPTTIDASRYKFEKDYLKRGFKYVYKKYGATRKRKKSIKYYKGRIKDIIKKIIGR